jgi:hypothetical protein
MSLNSSVIETETHIIHPNPRMSAAKLAEYVVAMPSRQATIVKQAQIAPKVVVIPYQRVRNCMPHAFLPGGLDAEVFRSEADQLATRTGATPWQKQDIKNSGEALGHLATIADEFKWGNASLQRSALAVGALNIKGVHVSVHPELVFTFQHRKKDKAGCILLNTGKNNYLSLSNGNGKQTAGDYLAALGYLLMEKNAHQLGYPSNSSCYAVDIFREKIYQAPVAYKTLLKNIEAACEMIALRWERIPVDLAELDEEELEA